MSPAGLLSLVLLVPTAPPAAGAKLQVGAELAYTGTVSEAVDRPGNRSRRAHDLEVRVFVLERRATWADAAVLTLLRRLDDAPVSSVLPEVTGAKRDREKSPPAARLDLVRIHEDGTVHLLAPLGPAPLRFAADAPARTLPAPLLDAFSPFEFGMFPPRPKEAEAAWAIASTDPARPAETWEPKGREFLVSEQCSRFSMVQQSADWEKPRGGQTSWQRVDAVWVSTLDGTARRVHRVIRQRDGVAPAAATVIEVKYDLKEQNRLLGRSFDRYRRDIETAYLAATELGPLMRDSAKVGPEPFKQRLTKLDSYLDENDAGTPYREAVLAVRRQLDAARKGEATLAPPPLPMSAVPKEPAIGQPAPDFLAGPFRLSEARGKPVVLVFYMPGQETANLSLAIAEALQKRYESRIAVVPLVVFADLKVGIAERDRLKRTIAVYDGSAVDAAYGVETFPRFLAIDAGGKLRWAFAGVGDETGYQLREQVEALLPSPRAVGAIGTTYPGGVARPPPRPGP